MQHIFHNGSRGVSTLFVDENIVINQLLTMRRGRALAVHRCINTLTCQIKTASISRVVAVIYCVRKKQSTIPPIYVLNCVKV